MSAEVRAVDAVTVTKRRIPKKAAERKRIVPTLGHHDPYRYQTLKSFAQGTHAQTREQRLLQRYVLLKYFTSSCLSVCSIGTRQAYLPGGHRTGAPGKHIVRGSGNYRLLDEKVRIFIAPSIQDLQSTPVRIQWVICDGSLTGLHYVPAKAICCHGREVDQEGKERNLWETTYRWTHGLTLLRKTALEKADTFTNGTSTHR